MEANKKEFLEGESPTLRYYKKDQNVPNSKNPRHSAVIWLYHSQL